MPTAQTVLNGLGVQVVGIFNVLKNLFLGVLISVYLLVGRKTFAVQAKLLLCGVFSRRWADMIEEEARYADKMFNGFLMGKLLDSAIIGLICFVATSVMRFESAAFISVVVGVTNIIPFFGPFIGVIPCALLLLLENPLHCLTFLVFVVILQQVDGNLIGPKILGNTTGLSSFWVLFAILLFGGLWGIVGMIIGVPLFAILYDIPSECLAPASSLPEVSTRQGFVISYYDSPLRHQAVSNEVYIDLLSQAKQYAYFFTPYLMPGEALLNAFVRAAHRGVDVRIIMPGIPDKKLVFRMSHSFYPVLLEAGVKIYEYTPGFVHAKGCIIDDRAGTIGTVNLDYRSLFLHFENNSLFYDAPILHDIKADFLNTQAQCRKMRLGENEFLALAVGWHFTNFCTAMLNYEKFGLQIF